MEDELTEPGDCVWRGQREWLGAGFGAKACIPKSIKCKLLMLAPNEFEYIIQSQRHTQTRFFVDIKKPIPKTIWNGKKLEKPKQF